MIHLKERYSYYWLIQIIFFSLIACSNQPLNTQLDPSWKVPNYNDYISVVRKNTLHRSKYDGFYNIFDINITKLNQDIRIKQLKLKANYSQWSKEEAEKHRQNLVDSMEKEMIYFVSFYTPRRDLNNLSMKDLGWHATLTIDGQKIPGKFKAFNNKVYKLQNLYEDHTIWHKGYYLKFELPTVANESKEQLITLTSPYGHALFDFKKTKHQNATISKK